jgi:predicted amidohydrolase
MDDLRVAAVSSRNHLGAPEKALADMRRFARLAKDDGAELVLFPELNVSGYAHASDALDRSEPLHGPSTTKAIALAKDLDLTLAFGLLENARDVVYNTHVVVDRDGVRGAQRKIHMPGAEAFYWRSGRSLDVIDIGKAKLGIAVCYDALFAEVMRTLYFKGAEVFLMPFAYWNDGPRAKLYARDIKIMEYRVHCWSNGCFGVVANNAGTRPSTTREGSGARFPGWAGAFSPSGDVLAWTEEKGHGESMVTTTLLADALREKRRDRYFIPRNLMPDRYVTLDGEPSAKSPHSTTTNGRKRTK